MTDDLPSWWSRGRHADRRPVLIARGQIKMWLRTWFESQGFTEVECSALVVSPGNEAHLHAFETELRTTAGARRKFYLHTSPEFSCKKLLAAGETKIFDFARVFRNRERGPLHAPEFTMLEWYRANEAYAAVIADTLIVMRMAAETTGIATMSFKGRNCDPRADAEMLTVADAFTRYAGIDLLATLSDRGEGDRGLLAKEAARTDFEIAGNDTWADIFSKVLVARVEPKLGIGAPTILYEYPRCEAALARATEHDARVAERFELYVCGVELANGFGELTDPAEQRRRFESEMDEKQRVYGERYPIDDDFLAALPHMPLACGVALGFDRLVMLATAARTIDDVLWTPAPGVPLFLTGAEQVLESVCRIPMDFHRIGTLSVTALVERSGYTNMPEAITREQLTDFLRLHAELIQDWLQWSDDKRVSAGWAFQQRSNGRYVVYYFPLGDELIFTDPAAACAEFIIRELESISHRS